MLCTSKGINDTGDQELRESHFVPFMDIPTVPLICCQYESVRGKKAWIGQVDMRWLSCVPHALLWNSVRLIRRREFQRFQLIKSCSLYFEALSMSHYCLQSSKRRAFNFHSNTLESEWKVVTWTSLSVAFPQKLSFIVENRTCCECLCADRPCPH
jgi:hypothetical protein